jgi:hypothetical protein
MIAAVRNNGGTVEYLVFDDEAHGFRKRANAIRAYGAILRFLDLHLKGSNSIKIRRRQINWSRATLKSFLRTRTEDYR